MIVPVITVHADSIRITDDRGQVVLLERPARRVVALYGAFNEILYGMNLGDRIVARTKADRVPPQICELPCIGTHMRPNVERIVGMQPDLVLQMGGRSAALQSVQALERFGIPVAVFHVSDFVQLFAMINKIGDLTGAGKEAKALVAQMRRRLEAVRQRLPKNGSPQVFFEVRSGNLLAAGQKSIVNDIILHAGGKNCVTLHSRLVRLSEEELLRLAPEVYLSQQGPMNPVPVDVRSSSRFASLPAVQAGQVFQVDEQMFSRPGPRNVDAVERLAGILYPDLFPEFYERNQAMELK
ncbi:iron complex transport system substrate-binding protein [Paucidesulfovibrio gracilis DSM 16080]|uniref:Iron complex transport system substrate-binding protein n=1 Tax=Paucidesulfovibrio gracilis DSM 16080 TaxID=1121449 RepID=A0A1T4WNW1_9BACT|nr:ABC transporter substrate-binding protein [Paucidesulfovibrio gracilis]SKA79034.1 iron complex transport system substrate-binding protein [Paucidesulfovibrio gracilis DSM 16080]